MGTDELGLGKSSSDWGSPAWAIVTPALPSGLDWSFARDAAYRASFSGGGAPVGSYGLRREVPFLLDVLTFPI